MKKMKLYILTKVTKEEIVLNDENIEDFLKTHI